MTRKSGPDNGPPSMADEPLESGPQQPGQDDVEALLAATQEGGADTAASNPAGESGLSEAEIEALASGDSPATATQAPPVSSAPNPATSGTADDVSLLLDQAQAAIASINHADGDLPPGVQPFRLESFGGTPANSESATIDLVRDVKLDLKIELGRTRMPLEDVLRLRRDAVVTLDKLAGDPVDVYVNGRMIARGEVLVLNDNFCVRVTELIVGDSAVA